ncbi:siderophore biosynthesis protein [Streptomyces eurocidicus]|uniref:Siderophore biosynthesis protein n=1 Tax=Streptomyces eurocidicus TaxID=66423 RepID=A0A2N8NMK0_STREU|nr:IucA/IucC family siderophore biosynthesis protein [Streptomyces eurocidicus]MBB5120709.1 siderophore synthetase component [Streptomyces eurocidicus]MBF6050370.1 IucA/IucC family siderophore biosynthesis protein [Streptomyces eurocidicus]PNE29992.1 siderophore biosynthesis protein [Streptomyces eurocidicus]
MSLTGTDVVEDELLQRVLSTLLREDVYGLRGGARPEARPDGDWLRIRAGEETLLLPVGPEGFQCEIAARRPVVETAGGTLTGLRPVLALLRAAAPDEDRAGYDAFLAECDEALATIRLQGEVREDVLARLAAAHGPRTAHWTGLRHSVAYDTLAAFRDHPVYPTGRSRSGLTESQLRAYAPEFHPAFALRWLALPRTAVQGDTGRLPAWWPPPSVLGLPGLDATHLALPVHPLTAAGPLAAALRAAAGNGPPGTAHLAERPWLDVVPTLSTRTVAVTTDPATHLKLPLATATLGLRNRRTIKPGTLPDGAAGQRLLEAVVAREPRFAGTVLLADERTHLQAGHELLAALVRRYPPGLRGAHVVPVAALLARAPGGALVAEELADHYYGGSLTALLDAYLTLLLDWHTTLFGYGIALESHQQNTSLVLDRTGRGTRLRLLFKDNDGPRVHTARLADRLGGTAGDLLGFDDRRILVAGDAPVADVFATITVHLCAGALAFELGRLGLAPLPDLLALLRTRLAEAVGRLADTAPGAAAVLRLRVLDADRLPVKAMITAGTLLTKERSGATDINKHYVDGPNYLRNTAR